MLEGFETLRVARDGIALNVRRAGRGAPLLLLHGHPQTHAMWHRVAPQLAQHFSVVLVDLRGYGDSDRPPAGAESAAYAKREMALDALAVMRGLGHDSFQLLAQDRGARAAHRLALDHPEAVQQQQGRAAAGAAHVQRDAVARDAQGLEAFQHGPIVTP
ncbi:MAG: alpha/beta fold hydrolase, partial [Ramlibacter sp.]